MIGYLCHIDSGHERVAVKVVSNVYSLGAASCVVVELAQPDKDKRLILDVPVRELRFNGKGSLSWEYVKKGRYL